AADGSVRDGLSLLDQAIALGGAVVTADQVRDMLGLADRAAIIDLFEAALTGKPGRALEILTDLHRAGADPLVVLRDLLDLTHFLTRAKVVPEVLQDPTTPEAERSRGGALVAGLSVPLLTRAWQILLKGVGEAMAAPIPQQAVEMVIIRLSYAADLPTPSDLIRQLPGRAPGGAPPPPAPSAPSGGGPAGRGSMQAAAFAAASAPVTASLAVCAPQPAALAATAKAPQPGPMRDFRALVQLFSEHREGALYAHMHANVHLVRIEPGLLEIRPKPAAPRDLVNRIGPLLSEWSGRRWTVVASFDSAGQPTLAEQDQETEARIRREAEAHPLVQSVLATFPGARIKDIRDTSPPQTEDGAADADSSPDFFDDEGELDL
ncbi:MAG: DNA polymerase III subunit gamma/tau, partial [Rhodospirillaceae bacterium]